MQSMNEITMGMTPQERKAYLDHQAMRAREEEELVQVMIEERKAYKRILIEDILKQGRFTYDQLKNKSVRYLEAIA